MKELLFGWVQDIAFYTLLMVVVLHVLPEKSQRKYLQFFMGIVLMILVISPFLSALGLDRQLDETSGIPGKAKGYRGGVSKTCGGKA